MKFRTKDGSFCLRRGVFTDESLLTPNRRSFGSRDLAVSVQTRKGIGTIDL
jgi:hypothetical protein